MKINTDDIKTAKFDDIFFIDDEQGLAVLEDIEEVPNTRDPKEGVLSAKGDFVYEIKFFINSMLALTNNVNAVSISVYTEKPIESKKERNTRDASPTNIKDMIKSRKKTIQETNSLSDDPSAIASETPTDSSSFAAPQQKDLVGYAKYSLRPALSSEDLRNYARYRSLENRKRREALSRKRKYQYITNDSADFNNSMLSPEGRIAVDSIPARSVTVSSPSGIASRSGTKKETSDKKNSSRTIKHSMDAIFKSAQDPTLASIAAFPVNTLKGQTAGHRSADTSRGSAKLNRSTVKKQRNPERTRKNVGQRLSVNARSVSAAASQPTSTQARLRSPSLTALSIVNIQIHKKTSAKVAQEAPVMMSFESRAIEFERELDVQIPKAGSKDVLYFEVQLLSKFDGSATYSKMYTIGHKEQLSEFLQPEIAPSIGKGSQMRGRNYLTLQQNDPVATQIIIEKKTLNPNSDDMNIPYEEIATVNVTQDMGIEIFEDTDAENISPNVIMYRAISASPLGDEGESYGSVVFPGLQPIAGIGASGSTNRVKCSIHAINSLDRIAIEITDIPAGVTALRLIREDLTSDSYTANSDRPMYVVPNLATGATMTMLGGPITKVLYEDTNVEPFRQYRYRCVFRMERGPEEEASGEEVIQYIKPAADILVTPNIGNVRVRSEDGSDEQDDDTSSRSSRSGRSNQSSVSFTMTAKASDDGIEAISRILSSAGVEQAFIDEVKNDRSRVSNISAFIVERLDTKTGRRESFGLQRPGSFTDNARSRRQNRVSPPLSGRTYKYVAKLCLRPPEALFKEALTKVVVQNPSVLDTATETIETLSQRFLSSFGVFPSLPSDTELKDKRSSSIRQQFLKGMTGIELTTDITMPSVRPTVSNITSYRTRRGYNVIRWRCEGDLSRIDHFIIYARYRGVTAPVGYKSGRGNGTYGFADRRLSGEIGEINYFVRIVYTDYTRSEASEVTTRGRRRGMSRSLWSKLMKVNARSNSGKQRRNISVSDRGKTKP